MGIGKRIKEARERAGLTQEELGKRVGVTGSAITNYEKETSHPKESVMYALMGTLGVDANFLFQDCVDIPAKSAPSDLSEEAQKVARDFDRLPDHGRGAVKAILGYESTVISKEAPPVKSVTPFPKAVHHSNGIVELKTYDQPAAAGLGNYLDEPEFHIEQYPEGVIPSKADFGIIISGDSMEPKVHDGGTVFVQASPSIDSGRIGIFVLNGSAYCKKLEVDRENRQVRLVSLNSRYDDIIVGEYDKFHTVGLVLGQWTRGQKQDMFGW